jgi:dolichol-phosphate mannosyltransferase
LIVLPAFNEEPRIGDLLEAICTSLNGAGIGFELVVVDDGSTDGTSVRARGFSTRAPLHLIVHPANLGLGATLRDGLTAATQCAGDCDIIVTMDADHTHPPDAIPGMVELIAEGHDVVVASRYRPGAQCVGVPLLRRLLSLVASLTFRLLYPIEGIRDYTSGFRAYRALALKRAFDRYGASFLDQDGFQCTVDIMLKLRRMALRFGEVPLHLRYDRKQGSSKMRVLATIRKTLWLIVRSRRSPRDLDHRDSE